MKSDIEKTIEARVAAAFDDILPHRGNHARSEVLRGACDLVRTLWIGKIYNALPKDNTTIPEYFLDAELEQFLNESIEECRSRCVGRIEVPPQISLDSASKSRYHIPAKYLISSRNLCARSAH